MMRRGPVELRRIEDRASRQVRFSKRRSGLFKKAYELAVLCDAEVALLVFSPAGKLYEFSSVSSLEKTMDRYQKFMNAERDVKHDDIVQNHGKEFDCPEGSSKLPEIAKRFLKTNFAKLNMDGLEQLEKDLCVALKWTRSRKRQLTMDSLNKRHDEAAMTMERWDGENEAEGDDDDGIAENSSAAEAAGSSRGNGESGFRINRGRPPARPSQPDVDT